VVPRLSQLKSLGVNALSLMPVAAFPGERNWGYDGVYPFAVQDSYGGPEGFKTLVNACHEQEMAVVLDVVYNHLGPEGNYLHDYGPYFTSKYHTPWGDAVNFDDAHSDEVRSFFIQNTLHWFENYHLDALRLDAIHAITDMSAYPFLRELADRVRQRNQDSQKKVFLIAESDLNDARIITSPTENGFGLDAQWCDDFHHALHALLTGEKDGYYADFGALSHLAKSMRQGYVLSGDYSVFRKRRHGNSSLHRPASQFVVFSQNHDQVGNRKQGERLSSLVGFEALKLAAGAVICSPYIPLLFMGEEYGEEAPFLYFVSHSDPDLVQAVREGRKKEFPDSSSRRPVPDPQFQKTFQRSCLNWNLRDKGKHRLIRRFYQELLTLRKTIPALSKPSKKNLWTREDERKKVLLAGRTHQNSRVLLLMNFSTRLQHTKIHFPEGKWNQVINSADAKWGGPAAQSLVKGLSGKHTLKLAPWSFSVFQKSPEDS
jgi:maltooligosyltrehalose trehalohydrolase